MRIFGIGVDITEITRMGLAIARQGQPFLDRCFLPSEQAYCQKNRQPERCYAARFAAKEAVAKALGTGIGAELEWLSMEVCHQESGRPIVVLHGLGAATAERLGIVELQLSISHSEHYAVGNAIAIVA